MPHSTIEAGEPTWGTLWREGGIVSGAIGREHAQDVEPGVCVTTPKMDRAGSEFLR